MHDSVLVELAQALEDILDAIVGMCDSPEAFALTQRHFGGLEDHVGPFLIRSAEDLWSRCKRWLRGTGRVVA